jgi:hypothetical protein
MAAGLIETLTPLSKILELLIVKNLRFEFF